MTVQADLTISEAAAAAGISAHTLRYYERAGLIDPIGRADSGHRRFTERDINWIVFLTKLRATGMPIRQMLEYADLVRAGGGTEQARLALLEAHRDAVRERIDALERNLELIDYKIDLYRERVGI
jgi:DNA-binding transcriptional MerR regulator